MGVTIGDDFDPALVRRARAGHRAARAELLRELQDMWYRYCLSMLHDPDAARDATQETALRFLAGLSRFRGESRLKTWSLGIALNVCREARRQRRSQPTTAELETSVHAEPAPDAIAIAREEARRLHHAIAHLPPRQREAVVLRYFERLSLRETALAMGCAVGTVKATLAQAVARLRETQQAPPLPHETSPA